MSLKVSNYFISVVYCWAYPQNSRPKFNNQLVLLVGQTAYQHITPPKSYCPGTLSTFVGTRNSIKSMYLPTSPFFWKGTCSQTLLTWLFLGGQPTVLQLRKTHLRKPPPPHPAKPRRSTPWDDLDQEWDPRASNEKGTKGPTRRPSTGGGRWELGSWMAAASVLLVMEVDFCCLQKTCCGQEVLSWFLFLRTDVKLQKVEGCVSPDSLPLDLLECTFGNGAWWIPAGHLSGNILCTDSFMFPNGQWGPETCVLEPRQC